MNSPPLYYAPPHISRLAKYAPGRLRAGGANR